MRIIHYIFGMPPLRSGGAIKYAMDLAEKQAELGHEVALVYPGEIRKRTEKISIHKNRPYHKVRVFEIINPLPVSLVTGIREIEPFVKKGDREVYKKFLIEQQVEIMHIHSLMGLHIEFLEAAKECGIKILFTTHDYFGVCPKTNLLCHGQICEDCNWKDCADCCRDAEDVSTLIKRQTHWFQFLIHSKTLVKLKHMLIGRGQYQGNNEKVEQAQSREQKQSEGQDVVETQNAEKRQANVSYSRLRQYYLDELQLVDVMLYNSSVTKRQYERRIRPNDSMIIGGMHKDIHDGRKHREYGQVVRFAYLGYPVEYKGYHLLIQVMDELDKKYHGQFKLNMYMEQSEYDREYIDLHEVFSQGEQEQVYSDMDVLVVPSMWAETYGLVVLEALSYGVPVVATSNVGASDLLWENKGMGYITEPTFEDLYGALERIIKENKVLSDFNEAICEAPIELDYDSYVKRILAVYEQKA